MILKSTYDTKAAITVDSAKIPTFVKCLLLAADRKILLKIALRNPR